jgi:protein-L-isoaspartate O-methyltransferase
VTDLQALSQDLLNRLTASGELTPAWFDAFAAVARHRFIPDMIWVADGAGLVSLHRAEDPQEWLRRAYGPAAAITQVDDRHSAGPGQPGRYSTSSASQPDVVALMLAALDAQPGMRVLEIGTGYNAALLAHCRGTTGALPVGDADPPRRHDPHPLAHRLPRRRAGLVHR